MLTRRFKIKLMLLLVIAASAIGMGAGNASACDNGSCAALFEGGRLIGYGCYVGSPGATCHATQSGCSLTPC